MGALHVTTESFEEEVINAKEMVLVDFWADWCGPCKRLLPVIEELAGEVKNAKICKVNTEEEPKLAEKYGIMSIPTLIVFKNGVIVSKTAGVRSKEEIKAMLEE